METAKTYIFLKDYTGTWKMMSPPFTENKKLFKAGDVITASNNISKVANILYTSPQGKAVELEAVGVPLIAVPMDYLKEGSSVVGGVITAGKFRLLNDFILEKGTVVNCITAPCPPMGEVKLAKGTVIEGKPISLFDFHTYYTKGIINMKLTEAAKKVSGILYFGTLNGVAKPYMIPIGDVEQVDEIAMKEKTAASSEGVDVGRALALAFIATVILGGIYLLIMEGKK